MTSSVAAARIIRRRYVGEAGAQVLVREAGEGAPLVLLHPTPESSAFYLPIIPALAAQYRVIALDTPGYGQSDRPSPPFTQIEQYAERLHHAIDALGVTRYAVIGHLTGAVIATEMAVRRPRQVAALVLSETFNWFTPGRRAAHEALHCVYPLDPDGQYLRDLWNRYRPGLAFGFAPETLNEHAIHLLLVNEPCDQYGHMGWEGAAPDAMTRYPYWDRAAQIQAPTLVLHGAESVLARAHARCLATIPHVEGEIVPGVRSLWFAKLPRGIPVDAPDWFVARVRRFLDSVGYLGAPKA